MRLRALAVLATVVGLTVGSLTGSSNAATHRSAEPKANKAVSIVDFSFMPNRLLVHVGDVVTWTNNGGVSHTSTAKGNVWNSGVLAPGAKFSFTFNTPGIFKYRCNIHHQMTAAIKVVAG